MSNSFGGIKMRKILLGLSVTILSLGLFAGCDREKITKEDKREVQKSADSMEEETDTNKNIDLLNDDFESFSKEDWEKIHLSKRDFKKFLKEISEKDNNTEEIPIKATLIDNKTIEVVFDNSDGESLENIISVPIYDAFIRQLYIHSSYYEDKQPFIRFLDNDGHLIGELDDFADFEE